MNRHGRKKDWIMRDLMQAGGLVPPRANMGVGGLRSDTGMAPSSPSTRPTSFASNIFLTGGVRE